MTDKLTNYQRRFYADKLHRDIHAAFIEIAFSKGHTEPAMIAKHLVDRTGMSRGHARQLVKNPLCWTLSDVSDCFWAYHARINFSLVPLPEKSE